MHGIISSLVLFFIPYGTMFHSVDSGGKEAADIQSFGFAVATILVIVVNLQVNASFVLFSFFFIFYIKFFKIHFILLI
jgi:phospholipid-translocating ATPase